MKNQNSEDYEVCIAKIFGVHGVKGNLKVKFFTENPKDIENFNNLFDDQGNYYKVKILSINKKFSSLIISIDGIKSRDQAELLVGKELKIHRSELPNLNLNQYYQTDLIGCKVELIDGTYIGKVINIYNFGASDIIEILDENSTFFYPLIKQFIKDISIKKRLIIVYPLEEEMVE